MKVNKVIILAGVILVMGMLFYSFSSPNQELYSKEINSEIAMNLLPLEGREYAKVMGEGEPTDYDGMSFFIFRLEQNSDHNLLKHALRSEEDFANRIQYFSHGIQSDLYIVNDLDTIQCSFSHWERNYGIRKDITITTMFKTDKDLNNSIFVWEDGLFTGIPQKIKLD